MGKVNNIKMILAAMLVMVCVGTVYSYPPENAAVLYYKAASIYEVDENMKNMLADLSKAKIEVNDEIREFVRKNRITINTVLDATEAKNCDWGMDFSQGWAMVMPHLSDMRRLTRLVVADAKILLADGDYEGAIEHCMGLYRMARHVNDRIYISYLVSIAINAMSNNCLSDVMGDMPQDKASLNLIKRQLLEVESIPFSIKPAISGERQLTLRSITPEKFSEIVEIVEICDEAVKAKILSLDDEAIGRSREYFKRYYAGVVAAFDMPYEEGHATMRKLQDKMTKDANSAPGAFLVELLAPATDRILSLKTRFETHNNAIKVGIEIYLIKAERGELPDVLPAGLGGDEFGGGDFIYERTAEGFVLRCVGKDLTKGESFEYKFKVRR
jgi:hypothetical protein